MMKSGKSSGNVWQAAAQPLLEASSVPVAETEGASLDQLPALTVRLSRLVRMLARSLAASAIERPMAHEVVENAQDEKRS